jgi:hypothetical protein
VLEKRRRQYEKRVTEQPFDYDGWFDLLRLEEDFYKLDPTTHLDRHDQLAAASSAKMVGTPAQSSIRL